MKQETKAIRSPAQSVPSAQTARLRPITGRHNARLKELRLAFHRGELTPSGECAIEGAKLVEEALRSGQHLEAVFFSESARPLAEKLLPQINHRTETLVLPAALFNSAVPTETPQGIAALVKLRSLTAIHLLDRANNDHPNNDHANDDRPNHVRVGNRPLVVASGLQDPGNLGTIFRSAEAFGAAGIFLTEGTVSAYKWKVLRSTAGSIFRLPFLQISSAELLPLLRERRVRLLATSSHKGTPLTQVDWTLPVAIFIGNEGAGLPREVLRQMDETIVIPQAAPVESLNAGVAASIVLYEWARKRK